MEIHFVSSSQNKLWNKKLKEYVKFLKKGQECSDELLSNLAEIKTLIEESDNFDEVVKNPLYRTFDPHELKGSRLAQISLSLTKKMRFVFNLEGVKNRENAYSEYINVIAITVVDVMTDYHKKNRR